MKSKPKKILFIVKHRFSYGSAKGISYGLKNSCDFLVNMLKSEGFEAKVVSVIDANGIDKEVHDYKPDYAFIEALYVTPNKFREILPLHPKVKFIVRLHSEIPFLASEGIALEWLKEYEEVAEDNGNLYVASNSKELISAFKASLGIDMIYAPNVYMPNPVKDGRNTVIDPKDNKYIDIGCYGANRVLKNILQQAFAAIIFGNRLGQKVKFHINVSDFEEIKDGTLKNIRNLFKGTKHQLVEHPWMNHSDFIKLIKRTDLCLQVSFSETYNIVSADAANNNIPVIGSKDIKWMSSFYQAEPTQLEDIVEKMEFAWRVKWSGFHNINKLYLNQANKKATDVWLKYLKYN